MNKEDLKTFLTVAAVANACPDGFSIDAKTFQPVKRGYSVAVNDTQDSFGAVGLANVIKYVNEHPGINAFGGWYNSENGMFYFDAVIICDDKKTAENLGRANKQIAIFDLNNLKEIRL